MRIFNAIKNLVRANKRASFKDRDSWLGQLLGGPPSVSGMAVSPATAMGLSSYFAAIRAISEDIAKLPLKVYRRVDPMGKEPLPTHPAWNMLHDETNPDMCACTFRETIIAHALGYHGGFAEIVRDGQGRAVAMWLLDPTSVVVERATDMSATRFRVTGERGNQVILRGDEVFHLHGLGFDGITGYAMTSMARDVVGSALGAQAHSGSFFANGASPTGILEVPGSLEEEGLKRLRESFAARHQGAAQANKPLILEEGITWKTTSVTPEDSQMIETMEFHIDNVARLFRIQPALIGHHKNSTFSNFEQQANVHLRDTLQPWLVRFEQEARRKLFLPGERTNGVFAEHQVEAMLRGDMAAQASFFQIMRQNGVMNGDEIRDKFNMNPIPGGDGKIYFINSASVTLEQASEPPQPPPMMMPQDQDEPDEPDGADDTDDEIRRLQAITDTHTRLMSTALGRLMQIERDRYDRHHHKRGFDAWRRGFPVEHEPQVRDQIGAVVDAYVAAMGAGCFTAIAYDLTGQLTEVHMTDVVTPMLGGSRDLPTPDQHAVTLINIASETMTGATP